MPQRSPLIDLPINRVSGHELSNATRSDIHGRACAGESYGAIARSKSLPRSTVSTTVKTVNTRRSVESKARIGRPTVHSDRDRRRILQHVRQHPMYTYDNLKRETGLDFSQSTYRRILRDSGVSHWLAKKRPALTPHQAQMRPAFVTLHRHKDWSNTLFSDECSVEKGVGKKRLWAFGDPSQKWDVDMIQTYNKGPGVTVMVWACVGSSVGGSDLIIMERDASAPRGGIRLGRTLRHSKRVSYHYTQVRNSSRMARESIHRSLRNRGSRIGASACPKGGRRTLLISTRSNTFGHA